MRHLLLPAAATLALALMGGCAPTPPAGGAAPAQSLAGAEWQVTHINGQPIAPGTEVTMLFADGRVSGKASCNRFMGGAETVPGGLSIKMSQMASSMMACPDPLMRQEQLFLSVVGDVTGYRIDADGTATLSTADGRTIRAVRG